MKISVFAAVIFSLTAAVAVRAQEAAFPCQTDAEQFCPGIAPGDGRLIECLKEHEAELSPECKAKGQEVKKKVSAATAACKGDLAKFCAEVKGGQGAKLRCLKDNEEKLSKGCKARIASGKKDLEKKNPCQADAEKFCKDANPGGGGLLKCLKAHEAELSQGCKARHAKLKSRAKARKARRAAPVDSGEEASEAPAEPQEN